MKKYLAYIYFVYEKPYLKFWKSKENHTAEKYFQATLHTVIELLIRVFLV